MVNRDRFLRGCLRYLIGTLLSLSFLVASPSLNAQATPGGRSKEIRLGSDYHRVFFVTERSVMVVNNEESRFAIYNLRTGAHDHSGSIVHAVTDVALHSGDRLAYLAGNSEGNRAFVSRFDPHTNALVSRELSEPMQISGIALDTGGVVFVARRDRGVIWVIDPKTLESRASILQPDRRMEVGAFGIGWLEASNDGPWLVALSNDGSLLAFLDSATGKTLSSVPLPATAGADNVVGPRPLDLASEVTTRFQNHADSVVVGHGADQTIFIFDLNSRFLKLDFVQYIRLESSGGFSAMQPQQHSGTAPSVLVASDDRQRVILLGSEQMGRVVVFSRIGSIVKKGESIPLAAPPSDLDVSGDGRWMVVLEDGPDGSVLSVIETLPAVDVPFLAGDIKPLEVMTAQSILVRLGYPIGVVDGIVGAETRRGVKLFQKESGLSATGEINDATLRELLMSEIAATRASISNIGSEATTFEQVSTLLRLGNALDTFGRRYNDSEALNEAVLVYQGAIESAQTIGSPRWTVGSAMNDVCWTLAEVGSREEDSFPARAKLTEAVGHCNLALEHIPSDEEPVLWAATQHSLGYALSKLGEREEGTGHLEEAVRAYEAALKMAESATLWPGADAQIRGDLADAEALLRGRYAARP